MTDDGPGYPWARMVEEDSIPMQAMRGELETSGYHPHREDDSMERHPVDDSTDDEQHDNDPDGERQEAVCDGVEYEDSDAVGNASVYDTWRKGWDRYEKTHPTWAVKLPVAVTVPTSHGDAEAEPGDYLCINPVSGSLYPCDGESFEQMYRRVDDPDGSGEPEIDLNFV